MALRNFNCYRKVKRAYTRKSKYKPLAYIKGVPPIKLTKFNFGDLKRPFTMQVDLVSKVRIQVRHNAIEAARQVVIRKLAEMAKPYRLQVRPYPHHVLRENKMITGAGADRMQTGMQLSFGKPMGSAAQLTIGQPIFSVFVDKDAVAQTKEALKGAMPKLPGKSGIVESVRK